MIAVAVAAASGLGGGGAVEVPLLRIVVAFVLCAGVALLAILLLRQRFGRGGSSWPRRMATGTIEVCEVRRVTLHADVGVVRHDGREYLLLLQAGASRVLCERDVP